MITVSDIGIQFGKRILFKEVNLYNKLLNQNPVGFRIKIFLCQI